MKMQFNDELHKRLFSLFILAYVRQSPGDASERSFYESLNRLDWRFVQDIFLEEKFVETIVYEYKLILEEYGQYRVSEKHYKSLDEFEYVASVIKAIQLIDHSKRPVGIK